MKTTAEFIQSPYSAFTFYKRTVRIKDSESCQNIFGRCITIHQHLDLGLNVVGVTPTSDICAPSIILLPMVENRGRKKKKILGQSTMAKCS
jgi:hypothetical protein